MEVAWIQIEFFIPCHCFSNTYYAIKGDWRPSVIDCPAFILFTYLLPFPNMVGW